MKCVCSYLVWQMPLSSLLFNLVPAPVAAATTEMEARLIEANIPVMLALSCHRFQGQSLDELCLHGHVSSRSASKLVDKHYTDVAVSRVRKLAGLSMTEPLVWCENVHGFANN